MLGLGIIGTAVAFLTDTQTLTNVFTIGGVKISLTEPTWDSTGKTKATNITPKVKVEKDPTITNTGTNDDYVFMNMNDYSQVELNAKVLGDDTKFLKENLDVDIAFYEGEMLGLYLPDKIEMEVVKTEPGVKGNTQSSAMKDATLETGMVIRIPLFVNEGEKVIVSTKDG